MAQATGLEEGKLDEKLKAAILHRFQPKRERIEVFISPQGTVAIVLSDPFPGNQVLPKEEREEVESGIHLCKCEQGKWPFDSDKPPDDFLQGGFDLHYIHFPGVCLNVQFARMRLWSFNEGEWA